MTERSAWDDEGKVLLLRQAIEGLAQTKGPEFVHAIEEIIFESHSKKRFGDFLTEPKGNTPEDFVNRVAVFYEAHHSEMESLFLYGDNEAWQKMYVTLQEMAYNFLLKLGFYPHKDTQNYAQECAQEAGTQLLGSHFHYLCSFQSWVAVLVHNVCYKQIDKDTKYEKVPFEEESLKLSQLADSQLEDEDEIAQLHAAIARLSDKEQQFVQWRFFDDPPLTLAQIAAKTGKSVSTAHHKSEEILRKLHVFLNE